MRISNSQQGLAAYRSVVGDAARRPEAGAAVRPSGDGTVQPQRLSSVRPSTDTAELSDRARAVATQNVAAAAPADDKGAATLLSLTRAQMVADAPLAQAAQANLDTSAVMALLRG